MRLFRRAAPRVAWALAFFCSYWPFTFTTKIGFIVWRFPYGEFGGDMGRRDLLQHVIAFVLIGAADRFGAREGEAGLKSCATSDSATSDCATSDSATSDCATSDSATSACATSDSATSDGATSDGATSDSARRRRRAINAPLLARAFAFCCLLEIGQLFLPTRHAELIDLVVNAGALLIGHVLASPL